MNWFNWVMLAVLIYQIFKSLTRDVKENLFKLIIVIAALIGSLALSNIIHTFNIGDLITINASSDIFNFLPFIKSEGFRKLISSTMFFKSTSAIVTFLLFLLINKLGIFIYTMISGLNKVTEAVKIKKERPRLKNRIGSLAIVIMIGIVIGLIYVTVLSAPLYEIYIELLI